MEEKSLVKYSIFTLWNIKQWKSMAAIENNTKEQNVEVNQRRLYTGWKHF